MAATRNISSEGAERELRQVMRRYTQRLRALEEATVERDEAIRGAMEARVPRARIIAAADLSPARIEQIRRGKRL